MRIRHALLFNEPHLALSLEKRGIRIVPPDPKDIVWAGDQEAALASIRDARDPFDLVILDLLMPKRAGEQVDTLIGTGVGYRILAEIRSRFGDHSAIVVYSNFI